MRKQLSRDKPTWVEADSVYFITVCAKTRGENQFCHPAIAPIILETVEWRHKNGVWFCSLVLLMPGHIHFLLSFPPETTFTKTIRDWKSWLGKKHSIKWQNDFFDHRLRRDESLIEKADYILHNPVRAGLVQKSQDWPFRWMPGE